MAHTHILRKQPSTSIDCKDCDFVAATQTSGTIYLPDPVTNPVGSRKVVKKTSATAPSPCKAWAEPWLTGRRPTPCRRSGNMSKAFLTAVSG